MINNLIPSRNDILSLQTESYDSMPNYNTNNYIIESEMVGGINKPSPGDVFHQEAIEYLKNKLKLPEIEARAYKSIAYRKIKETHPEANHLERAKLMIEMVKEKNFIKDNKDKLSEIVKILETIDEEKKAKANAKKSDSESETKSRRSQGSRSGSKKSQKGSRKSSRRSRKSSRKSRKGSRKSQNGGNINNFSETSIDNGFIEANKNIPYYNEYRNMKTQYLQQKLKQNGGVYNESAWPVIKPNYLNPTTPDNDLIEHLARIKDYILPNLEINGKLNNLTAMYINEFVKLINEKYGNIIN